MISAIPTAARSIDEYREHAGDDLIEEIVSLAEPLRGSRILHLSAVPSRAGLSGTVSTLTSLSRDIGLAAEWRVIRTRPEQIVVNQALNRALNGYFIRWTPEMSDLWLGQGEENLGISPYDYDFIVLHDAELAGTVAGGSWLDRARGARWIWHCHSDASKAQPEVRDLLMSHTQQYHRRIISSTEQSPIGSYDAYSTVPPTIDPLDLRNRDLPEKFVEMVLRCYGINPKRPFALSFLRDEQDVSVASHVIGGFRLAKEQVPELQLLVLVGDDASDSSDGANLAKGSAGRKNASPLFADLAGKTEGCRDVHLVPMPRGIGSVAINAFQQAAVAVIEGSEDEQLTMNLLEAMWKMRPVIVGKRSADRLSITDGHNGRVARLAEEIGRHIVRLAEPCLMAKIIGQAAREHVRESFLITRLLHEYLTILRELSGRKLVAVASAAAAN